MWRVTRSNLKDAVDNVATNGCACSENGCIPQFFAKFLSLLLRFTRWFAVGASSVVSLCYRHRHISVAHWATILLLRDGLRGACERGRLLIKHLDVAAREDTLQVRALVLAFPPFSVHVFGHNNTVIGGEGQVASIGGLIGIQGTRGAEGRGWRLVVRRGWRTWWRLVSVGFALLLVEVTVLLLVCGAIGIAVVERKIVERRRWRGRRRNGLGYGDRWLMGELGNNGLVLLGSDERRVGEKVELLISAMSAGEVAQGELSQQWSPRN